METCLIRTRKFNFWIIVTYLEVPHVDETMQGALGNDGPLAEHADAVHDGVLSLVLVTLGQEEVHHDWSVFASCNDDMIFIRDFCHILQTNVNLKFYYQSLLIIFF